MTCKLGTLIGAVVLVGAAQVCGPAAAVSGDRALRVALGAAETLAQAQHLDGSWPDVAKELAPNPYRDTYGEATIGAALLELGSMTRDARLVSAGLRGVSYSLAHPPLGSKAASDRQFRVLALGDAWATAEPELTKPANAALRKRWLRFLRSYEVHGPPSLKAPAEYQNRIFLEDLVSLRLCSLGAPVARCDPRLRRRVAADPGKRAALLQGRGSGAAMLTDPPLGPLAYHALIAAALARSVSLASGQARKAIVAALGRAVSATSLLQAPDGDLAWAGRSGEQAWALAASSYASRRWALASRPRRGGSRTRRRLVARAAEVETLSTRRLQQLHAAPGFGFLLAPAMLPAETRSAALSDVDGYASSSSYAGLTLLLATWAAQAGPVASERRAPAGPVVLSNPRFPQTAVVRSKGVWASLSGGDDSRLGSDMRRAPGLLRLKAADASGKWRDLIAGVPRLAGLAGPAFPGPSLLTESGVDPAFRTKLRLSSGGVRMDYSTVAASGSVSARGLSALFLPVGCGLRIELPAVNGSRARFAFNAPGSVAVAGGGTATWSGGSLTMIAGERIVTRRDRATALAAESTKVAVEGRLGEPLRLGIKSRSCD